MIFLFLICFALLFILVFGSIVGAFCGMLHWRLFIGAVFPPCIFSALILVNVGLDGLFSMSASEGGAIAMGVVGLAPFYYGAFGIGILIGDFLRKRVVSKTDSRHDT
jgi:hypothetical protein